MALLPGSPAIDAGSNTGAPTTDQRGFTRIVGGTIDIGAYEMQGPAVLTVNSLADTDSRDNVLTLREAIELNTGLLSYTSLSAAEKAQISGHPDAGGQDTIVFSVTGTIDLQSALPSLGNVSIQGPGDHAAHGGARRRRYDTFQRLRRQQRHHSGPLGADDRPG
jgi:CSLREA domain-containing protein